MKRILSYLLASAITLAFIGAIGLFGLYTWVAQDLPSITKIDDYQFAETTTVYARDGSIMGYLYDQKRFLVNLDQIPKHVQLAFIAAEDANFYSHQGVDFKAILRAFIANLRSGEKTQGGSTITQQVIKRFILSPEQTYTRKIKEAILSLRLEEHLTKDQILYLYVNEIFFGHNAYGIESAARTYFGKHAADLTLAEGALLAGIPKSPTPNNPYGNPKNALARQRYVLGQLYEKGFIPKEEYETALAQTLEYKRMEDPTLKIGAWYFEEVRRQLLELFKEENVIKYNIPIDKYGEDAVLRGGLHIYTSMDPAHQLAGEEALRTGIYDASKRQGWKGPLEQLTADKFDLFVTQQKFQPEQLDNAGWVKGLVCEVQKNGIAVRLGEYTGFISAKTLSWARSGATDPSRIVSPGDVIWVSAYGAKGTKNPVSAPAYSNADKKTPEPYDSSKVTKDKNIELCLEQGPLVQGALASIDIANKDIIALVGGYAFSTTNQFNRATQAYRQPGSSFKPFVYSAALDNGYTAGSIILDSPFMQAPGQGIPGWSPNNIDRKFLGPILLRTALAKSRNVCTVRIAQNIGMHVIAERAKSVGIPGNIPEVLAVSLGSYDVTPLSMAEAFTTFANQGKHFTPRLIHRVTNRWGEDIIVFNPEEEQVISPQNAYIMTYLLSEVVNAGTGGRARVLNRPVAGKTGTSNDVRDAWFIGYTPYVTTSVFIGNDDNAPMNRAEGGSRAALPVFVDYNQRIGELYPPDNFPVPENITRLTIDAHTGLPVGAGSEEGITLPFINGTEPSRISLDQLEQGDQHIDSSIDIFKQ